MRTKPRIIPNGIYQKTPLITSWRVEITLNLDGSKSDIPLATEAKLVKWNNNVEKMWDEFSQKCSQSEQRHDKEQRCIAKAIAAQTTGQSS